MYLIIGWFEECYDDGTPMSEGDNFDEIYGVFNTEDEAIVALEIVANYIESLGNYKRYSGEILVVEMETGKLYLNDLYKIKYSKEVSMGKVIEV